MDFPCYNQLYARNGGPGHFARFFNANYYTGPEEPVWSNMGPEYSYSQPHPAIVVIPLGED